jgi:hypothetical protein
MNLTWGRVALAVAAAINDEQLSALAAISDVTWRVGQVA